MSASSDYLRVLTDITREGGATRAATQRANSQIWGSAVAKLGDFASDAVKQYGIDKKAKKQEQEDQAFKDAYTNAATEFQAQQQTAQMGNLTGAPGQTVPGEQGPELAGARAPRLSPFPSPSELLKINPTRAVPMINAIAALKSPEFDPIANDDKRRKYLKALVGGLPSIPEELKPSAWQIMRADALRRKTITPEDVPEQYDPTWVTNTLGYGQEPQKPAPPKEPEIDWMEQVDPKTGKTVKVATPRVAGTSVEVPPKATPELTPDQVFAHDMRLKEFGLAQQRLALAIKNSNKPAIDRESNGLADAVMAEPELWGQLTAGEKGKIAGELQKRGFKDFKKDPSATLENRLSSAQAVLQTGNDMIRDLKDPKIAAMLGPAMGRFNSMADFVGNPPPEFARLAGLIESYSLANMGVHGMRATSGAEAIKQTLGAGRHTPASIIAAIEGLNGFATHLIQNEAPKRLPTDTPAATPKANPFR